MKKLLGVFGTRPEFIKMYPVITTLKNNFLVDSVNTGQHVELLEPLLKQFDFTPTYILDTLQKDQTLNGLSSKILIQVDDILNSYDAVIVQGDTTTAMVVALAAFNKKKKVIHIEAGLRSHNKDNPFPEEINRRIISEISDFNFCPCEEDLSNLNNTLSMKNYVVGNTVTDMLRIASNMNSSILQDLHLQPNEYVLVTCHRRENHMWLDPILNAIDYVSNKYKIVLPVHMNPEVRNKITNKFKNNENVILTESLPYVDMINIIKNCKFVISDSGGIQEEAPSFNKFVYVLRTHTERNQSVELGYSKLVGNKYDDIISAIDNHIDNIAMLNPYGDGYVSEKILEILKNEF